MYSEASYHVLDYVLQKKKLTTMYGTCNCENKRTIQALKRNFFFIQGTLHALEPFKGYPPTPLIW